MDGKAIVEILKSVKSGKMSVQEAVDKLSMCYDSLGFANLDIGRHLRTGVSEVLLCEGKTRDQVVSISRSIASYGQASLTFWASLLFTRDGSSTYRMG